MFTEEDRKYLVRAYEEAVKSPDPSTQNGAVIITELYGQKFKVCGCNTFPKGVESTPERLERPLKYNFIEHAERFAILKAAKLGLSCNDRTMYVPWAACADCARAIICSGIKRVVTHKRMMDATPDHWKESIAHAMKMMAEAGVEVVYFEDELPEAPAIRFNGKMWQP